MSRWNRLALEGLLRAFCWVSPLLVRGLDRSCLDVLSLILVTPRSSAVCNTILANRCSLFGIVLTFLPFRHLCDQHCISRCQSGGPESVSQLSVSPSRQHFTLRTVPLRCTADPRIMFSKHPSCRTLRLNIPFATRKLPI